MWATLYRPLSEEYPTFREAKLTDIFKIISYDYTKRFTSVGEFTMEIPTNEPAVPYITADTILVTSDGDSLYVSDTEETTARFTIKGYDLKYLLAMRLTLFPSKEQDAGTYGYYVVKGSTEHCLKDIVGYNITKSSDKNRHIYGFWIAEDQNRGIKGDRYMTRLETLDSVAEALCCNANIGWDVTVDTTHNRYVFDVIVPTDRSDGQNKVSKVVFAEQFLNVTGFTRQLGVSSLKNAVYAVNGIGGSNVPYVQLVNRDDEAAAGTLRKETTVNVNCDYDEIKDYALKESEDKIQVDVFEMEVQAADTYKKEWFIGDIVTFKHGSLQLDASIIEVQVSRSADSYSVKLVAGKNVPPTTIGALNNAVNRSNNNKLILSSSGSTESGGSGGVTREVKVVTNVNLVDGALKLSKQILHFTNGLLTSVTEKIILDSDTILFEVGTDLDSISGVSVSSFFVPSKDMYDITFTNQELNDLGIAVMLSTAWNVNRTYNYKLRLRIPKRIDFYYTRAFVDNDFIPSTGYSNVRREGYYLPITFKTGIPETQRYNGLFVPDPSTLSYSASTEFVVNYEVDDEYGTDGGVATCSKTYKTDNIDEMLDNMYGRKIDNGYIGVLGTTNVNDYMKFDVLRYSTKIKIGFYINNYHMELRFSPKHFPDGIGPSACVHERG